MNDLSSALLSNVRTQLSLKLVTYDLHFFGLTILTALLAIGGMLERDQPQTWMSESLGVLRVIFIVIMLAGVLTSLSLARRTRRTLRELDDTFPDQPGGYQATDVADFCAKEWRSGYARCYKELTGKDLPADQPLAEAGR